jgi:creatinine amidohydrolase
MHGRDTHEAIRNCPVGFLPIGCLEKHGDHLPMGLDGLKAHKVCVLAAKALGGVVFPPHYYAGVHNMSPNQLKKYTAGWGNIYTDTSANNHIKDIIHQIILVGVKILILYSGHYPQSQTKMLQEIAVYFDEYPACKIIPFWESMIMPGDHAGFSETSIMLFLDRSLVDMTRIHAINYEQHGWGIHDSPEKATYEQGEALVTQIIGYLKGEIESAMNYG